MLKKMNVTTNSKSEILDQRNMQGNSKAETARLSKLKELAPKKMNGCFAHSCLL